MASGRVEFVGWWRWNLPVIVNAGDVGRWMIGPVMWRVVLWLSYVERQRLHFVVVWLGLRLGRRAEVGSATEPSVAAEEEQGQTKEQKERC